MSDVRLSESDFQQLLRFRTALRRFLHWSGAQAASVGLTASQHQLLLAVRGHAGSEAPDIGELAEVLLLRHHSAVELINRAERMGLVSREPDPEDRRRVRIHLTENGLERIERLSAAHRRELAGMRRDLLGVRGEADDE